MSWAGYERALPPEMIPHNLFDRLFGKREQSWIERKQSVLDLVRDDFKDLNTTLGKQDQIRVEEHLASVRDLERSIASLPPEYAKVHGAGDRRRCEGLSADREAAIGPAGACPGQPQTRVATYMLTKCQSLVRLPWLGYTTLRHHDYTHTNSESPQAQRILRDICRWHVEEFAYLVGRLKAIREGDGTLLDHCCLLYIHEHAEANIHKNNGLVAMLAGHLNGMTYGNAHESDQHDGRAIFGRGERYSAAGITSFPTASRKLDGLV